MKYVVTSRHSEDVGLGSLLSRGEEFDDEDVPDHMKDRVKEMEEEGVIAQKDKQEEQESDQDKGGD
jgi:hypothetical protein